MDLATIGTTLSGALVALGLIGEFFRRGARNQRAELRRTRTRELALRALVEDWDTYSYELERALRAALRGRRPAFPLKPASLVEAHHDEPDAEFDIDADPVEDAGPGPRGAGQGGRHAYRGRGA